VVVLVVLIGIGVHSCQVSATNSALQDYANQVSSLEQQSVQTGANLFKVLSTAAGAGSATTVQTQVDDALSSANTVLHKAQAASVPDQVKDGNAKFVLALRMRADGISHIASEIQPALGTSATKESVNAIAKETARFYASDVLYKDYAVPEIYGAVHAAGTRFSGLSGGQFLPNVQWELPSFIAAELHVTVAGLAPAKVAPGLHGHSLTSVTVAGTTLQTGSTNTIPSKPAPVFTLNFNNGGTNTETNVKCRVSVSGTNVSGQTVVPQTTAGQNATCQVKLNGTPPVGTQSVVATVEKVPGEKNVANNTQTFQVTFQ
jgi:hypothetical protein